MTNCISFCELRYTSLKVSSEKIANILQIKRVAIRAMSSSAN